MPVRYNPYERGQLEALLDALGGGLSGETALPIFQGLQAGALERQAQRRAMMQQLPDLADWASGQAAAGVPRRSVSAAFSGYPGRMEGALERVVRGLYPQGGTSPLYQSPEEQAALDVQSQQALMGTEAALASQVPVVLDFEDLSAIEQEVLDKVGAAQESGESAGLPYGLHEVRTPIMARLRAMGVAASQLTQVFNLIESIWTNRGGSSPPSGAAPTSAAAPAMRAQPAVSFGGSSTFAGPQSYAGYDPYARWR